jgi:hypothetical protein
MNVILVILFLFAKCSPSKDDNNKLSHMEASSNESIKEEILYKKRSSREANEYTEGAYYVYDTKENTSDLLFEGILMDYSEAWITVNNQYVIFTISSIVLLDENRDLIERFDFKETELVIGAQYNRNVNTVYFLLKDMERSKVDLCQFKLENKELKKIIESTEIPHENIEMPFKKMFFMSDNNLFIEDYCFSFWLVNFKDNSISKVNFDEGNCYGYFLGKNRKGIVYAKYTNASKTSYELKEFNFNTKENTLLLDGKNRYSRPVSLKLFSDRNQLPFLVQIDEKLFLYDYKSFNEVKINSQEILQYSDEYLIYLDNQGKVRSVAL